jgi:hypothetical protein
MRLNQATPQWQPGEVRHGSYVLWDRARDADSCLADRHGVENSFCGSQRERDIETIAPKKSHCASDYGRTRAKLQALSNEGCGPALNLWPALHGTASVPGVALRTAFGDVCSAERTRFSHNCARTEAPRISPRQETGSLRLVTSSCSRGHAKSQVHSDW